jgi:hypothetical protein
MLCAGSCLALKRASRSGYSIGTVLVRQLETSEISSTTILRINEMKRLLARFADDVGVAQHGAVDQDHARWHT